MNILNDYTELNNVPAKRAGKLRVLFVVNVDWFFLSHRLPIAKAMRDAGAEVIVATRDTGKLNRIRTEGMTVISLPMTRKGINPIIESKTISFLMKLYKRLKPDLIHHVTIKPIIYGSLAARLIGAKMAVVNAVSGLGYVFSANKGAKILRPLVEILYRLALRYPNSQTIFQNRDDFEKFVTKGFITEERCSLIRGSGVDCNKFKETSEPAADPIVLLPARMLWQKGVKEFVDAAKILNPIFPKVRFVLVGAPDLENPTGISLEQLESWNREGIVEWWGYREDMAEVLALSSIIVLPSTYPEGVPKVLLETAASTRPIIASDIPGCREIVKHGVNGLLVSPQDGNALVDSIRRLIESPELRRQFGRKGREIAIAQFAEEIVIQKTLNIYRGLLDEKWMLLKQAERGVV